VWQLKLHPIVCTSTCETEYVAGTEVAKEALWLGFLLEDMGLEVFPAKLRMDNQGAIFLADNCKARGRSKHINIRYHFIRQCVDDGAIKLAYIGTHDQMADSLTKALSKEKLHVFIAWSGLS